MRLIVTNGDAAVSKLRAGGIKDPILPWRDVLHEGPVPDGERLERLSQIRAAFIAKTFGFPHDEVALSFAERDLDIRAHRKYERIEIWLEHDLYDQLQLIQILNFFVEEARGQGIFLVHTTKYLGTISKKAVPALEREAQPITPEQFHLARQAWRAFTSPNPAALVRLSRSDTSALPFLKKAVQRLLAEFPDPVHGLSLTEERVLRRLEHGPATAWELFRDVTAQEDARFMGDISFLTRLNALTFANEPLISGVSKPIRIDPDPAKDGGTNAVLRITSAGLQALNHGLDHAMVNDVDRWIGGTRLRPAILLRYDRKNGELIAPP